jgi:hypothetical protein
MTKKDLEEYTKRSVQCGKQNRAAAQDLPDFMENAAQEKCP